MRGELTDNPLSLSNSEGQKRKLERGGKGLDFERRGRRRMEREEARDVTAPSPAKRGTAEMFHEVKHLNSRTICGICDKNRSLKKVSKDFSCVCQIGFVWSRLQIGAC